MSNGKDLIDFNLVKQSVSMEMLIIHLGLYPFERKGDEVRLKCPFHNGKSDNSMAINLAADSFYCFGCKAHGGVLEFVAGYEGCTIRESAIKLDEWFQVRQNKDATATNGREADCPVSGGSETVPQLTPLHLIASIEYQLARLKQLLISR